jgi:hypothetical protein
MGADFRTRSREQWVQALDVAVHASSLWDGFVFQRDSDALFRIWDQGGIELHFKMAELAIVDAALCAALFLAADSSFPGVYNYEVTEALGQMVAGHLVSTGAFPTEAEWQNTLAELALSFFEQGNFSSQEVDRLRQVVIQWLPLWQGKPPDSPDPPNSLVPPGSQHPFLLARISHVPPPDHDPFPPST